MSVEGDLGTWSALGTWVGLPDTITMGRDRSTVRPAVTPCYEADIVERKNETGPQKRGTVGMD